MNDYKDQVIVNNVDGRPDVITFASTASKILQDFHKDNSNTQNIEEEKMRIVKAAGDIIRNDIKLLQSNTMFFPSAEEIEASPTEFVPTTLLAYFLSNLFTCKDNDLIKSSIAQAVIQNVRPKSILAPMQLGLAVLFHRHFGSRYLIDTLNRVGFCSSYREVLRFESCSAQQHGVNLYDVGNESFLHYIGDNADHNINTLDGLATFHGMGIITSVTPGNKNHTSMPVSSKDVIDTAKIELKYFTFHQNINLVEKF